MVTENRSPFGAFWSTGLLAVLLLSFVALIIGCAPSHESDAMISSEQMAESPPRDDSIAEESLVDCLVPSPRRRLGQNLTYLGRRLPARTSASSCEMRGGEYVPPDRSNLGTALRVWLPTAEEGDPVAQYRVGEIYEEGEGGDPNPRLALQWYRRAAEQGYEPAKARIDELSVHLAEALSDAHPGVRYQAAKALGRVDEMAAGADPLVYGALDSSRLDAGISELLEALIGMSDTDVPGQAILYFEHDDADLLPAEARKLDLLVSRYREAPGVKVLVLGHADKTGTPGYNVSLSQHRADTVRDYLVVRGMPAAAVTVRGAGDADPMVSAAGHRAENRRAEVLFRTATMHNTRMKVLGTVYDFLPGAGEEPRGYGLYTYVLFPYNSERVSSFLQHIIKTTLPAKATRARNSELNLLLIPVKQSASAETLSRRGERSEANGLRGLADSAYDYSLAQEITFAVCRNPYGAAVDFCDKARGPGPYLLTYAKPITGLENVAPPYLIADYSEFHEQALLRCLNAYKEQVKRSDYTDRERVELFRLRVLNWMLHTKDVFEEIAGAVPNISEVLFAGR